MSKVLLSILLVLPAITMGQIALQTNFAMQGFNPLNPTAVGHPVITGKAQTADQLLGYFVVTNYAKKAVVAIEYGWRIAAPLTCLDSTLPASWDKATVEITIASGAEATIPAPAELSASGSSKRLADLAYVNKTPVVLIIVGLLRVTYADGSQWSDEQAISRQIFDGGMHEKIEQCQKPDLTKQTGKCGRPSSFDKDIDHQFVKGGDAIPLLRSLERSADEFGPAAPEQS